MHALSAPVAPLLLPAPHPAPVTPEAAPPFEVFLDEMGYYLPSIRFNPLIGGAPGRGKSAFVFASSKAPSPERGQVKLVAVGGDDALLAQWTDLSPIDWTLQWQGWFPPESDEPVPCIDIAEQSESGMLLAVDVAWTCQEMEDRLASRFPELEIYVSLAPTRSTGSAALAV